MSRLDQYIIRQFAINFFILIFVLMSLYVLIDLVSNMDEFYEAAMVRAAANTYQLPKNSPQLGLILQSDDLRLGRWQVMMQLIWVGFDWFGPMAVLLFVYVSGLVCVGAMGFTFTDLVRKGELVAMVSSGISMHRIAMPVLAAGLLVNVMALPVGEWLIPRLATKLTRMHSQLGHEGIHEFAIKFAKDSQGHLLSAASFDPKARELHDVNIIMRDDQGKPISRITADQAVWIDLENRWQLIGGNSQRPGLSLQLNVSPSQQVGGPTADIPEVDYFYTSLTPDVLIARRAEIYASLLSIRQLSALSQTDSIESAVVTRIVHRRFSMMMINTLVLVMGIPFFLCREPTNMLNQAVRATGVSLGTWVTAMVILQAGQGQVNPIFIAWLPVVVALPAGAYLFGRIKT